MSPDTEGCAAGAEGAEGAAGAEGAVGDGPELDPVGAGAVPVEGAGDPAVGEEAAGGCVGVIPGDGAGLAGGAPGLADTAVSSPPPPPPQAAIDIEIITAAREVL
jgi:hypothetical protein